MLTATHATASHALATSPHVAIADHRLHRLVGKPNLDDWQDDDALTLIEAAELDVTVGKLSLKGLRTAVNKGEIASSRVAGKIWITKAAVNKAFSPKMSVKVAVPAMSAIEAPAQSAALPKKSLVLAKIASQKNASAGHRLRDLS